MKRFIVTTVFALMVQLVSAQDRDYIRALERAQQQRPETPNRNVPAHVHFTVFTPSGARYHAGEVKFDDDPLVSPREREASKQAREQGEVRPVRREAGAEHVDFTLRIDAAQRF